MADTPARPHYRTWIRTRPVVIFAALTGACLLLSLLAIWSLFFLVLLVPAGIFGYILAIVGLSRWRFSRAGGDYQARVHQLIVARVPGEAATVLDVGCGSGHLLARIAQARPATALTGLDYWGSDWEYSRELCEANFRAEGLDGRATFIQGTASRLPTDLGPFDAVVSCLTFHEVQDVEDKTVSLREAVGRLSPGGRFVFIDLFADPKFYPDAGRITAAIEAAGGAVTERKPLRDLVPMPFPLGHKRVLGFGELIAGERRGPAAQ